MSQSSLPPWRAHAAVALLVAAAMLPALAGAPQFAHWRPRARRVSEPISAFESRFAPLREALRDRVAVGYLAPAAIDTAEAAGHLYLTRYTLAPLLVLDDRSQADIVADGVRDATRLPAHLEVVRDFGGGLLLLRQRR